MNLLKVSTNRTVMAFMSDAADNVTGKTGLTLTITASKDGGAFASISPTVVDLGSGWYSLALTTTHTNTAGELALHITGTNANPNDMVMLVVTDLPGATVSSVTGAVGSVTGAVGSVTGAVGSVTGNVGGSVASVTAGVTLAAAAVQAIWDALTSALTVSGSIGKLLVDNVNATISSRLASASYTAPPSAATIAAAVWDYLVSAATTSGSLGKRIVDYLTGDVYARVGAPAGASVSADIAAAKADTAAIKLKTDNLPASPANEATLTTIAGYIDTEVAAIKAKTDNLPASPANEATLTTIAGYIDTEVAAIKAKTDNLPASPANEATLTTIAAYIDTEVAAIKAKTDNLPSDPADASDIAASFTGLAVKKNTALAGFMFPMWDSTNHAPLTGITPTVQRSIDGGSFAACTNAASEIASGAYKIDLSAADLNGTTILLKFSGTGADTHFAEVLTHT